MRISWSRTARQDRDDVWLFVARDNVKAAVGLDQRFARAVARLAEHPHSGRSGAVEGTREIFPHPSYRLVYSVQGDLIEIIAIVHAARQWPPEHD